MKFTLHTCFVFPVPEIDVSGFWDGFLRNGLLLSAIIGLAVNFSPLCVEASEVPIATSSTGNVSEIGAIGAARAGGYSGSIHKMSSGKSFASDWQASAYSGDATLIYGYNTVLINEDYSHASIEVRHSGTSIQYQNTWYD